MSKSSKPVSAGIGNSKTHAAAPGTFDPAPERHAGGRKLGKGPLDHLLASHHTDEALKDRESIPRAQTEVVRDEFQKRLDGYGDAKANKDMPEPWMATDPMKAVADEHCPEGHVPRFLGDRKVQLDGMRGWNPVIGANGDPVKLGNMTLASMPREMADRRNDYFRRIDKDRVSGIRGEIAEHSSRLASAKGLSAAQGEVGFQRTHGNAAALDE